MASLLFRCVATMCWPLLGYALYSFTPTADYQREQDKQRKQTKNPSK